MQPADHRTLPRRDDAAPDALGAPWRDVLAPGGQLALPVAGAQLGLDGRSYAAPAAPTERSEPSLGPQHGVLHGPLERPGPVQLALDLADVERVPQLGLWDRLDQAHAVLPFESRQAKCHRTRRAKGPVNGYRTERGSWSWSGLVRCGIYACPACGPRRARDVSAALGCAIRRHRASASHADVWMLTATVPHTADDLVGVTVERLYHAWSAFVRSSTWRDFAERWQLRPVVRVLDATFGGANGAHPHFHVLLLPLGAASVTREAGETLLAPWSSWLEDERRARLAELTAGLWPAWDAACAAAGVERARGANAIELTPAERAAAYFVAWGLADEVGASPAKARSHLRLLDARAAGVDAAGAAFAEWVASTAGRQWVTGLGDLRRTLGISDEDCESYVAELRAARDAAAAARGEPVQLVRPLYVAIPELLYPAALSLGWARVTALLDDADARGLPPQAALLDELRAESLRLDLLRTRARAGPGANAPPG